MLYLRVYPMQLVARVWLSQTVAHFSNLIQQQYNPKPPKESIPFYHLHAHFLLFIYKSHFQAISFFSFYLPTILPITTQTGIIIQQISRLIITIRYWLQSYLYLMQNQENFDPNTLNQIYNSMIFADNQEDLCLPLHLLYRCPQNEQDSELPQRNDIFSNPIDHLAAESFCTVERGSLQIVPEQPSMDINTKLQEAFASTIKSIESSFIFHEQEGSEENERKLIIKTEELTLRSSETQICEDIFNEYSPKKHRSLLKNLKPKVHIIKQPKQLIKELKREYKYNDSITADVVLSLSNTIIRLKFAKIQPIVSQKGHLSGLIIKEGEQEYKVKVSNNKFESFNPGLQLWNENGQTWQQFTFKIKIRNT